MANLILHSILWLFLLVGEQTHFIVSSVYLFCLFQPRSWFIPKVVWLSVTNPVTLSWRSYCCWAFLPMKSLPMSCVEIRVCPGKKCRFHSYQYFDKMKIFTQLYWNLLRHLVIAAYWPQLAREFQGSIMKYKKACTSFLSMIWVLKVSNTQCVLYRVKTPRLI